MAWSVSQRCRKALQLDGSESGLQRATWFIEPTDARMNKKSHGHFAAGHGPSHGQGGNLKS
jgi:hypothetical protein